MLGPKRPLVKVRRWGDKERQNRCEGLHGSMRRHLRYGRRRQRQGSQAAFKSGGDAQAPDETQKAEAYIDQALRLCPQY